MKTKEEILHEHYPDFDIASGWIFDGSVYDVFSAMEEYAKQQVIAFSNWVFQNKIIQADHHSQYGEWFYSNGEGAAKNTEELYKLFLKSQN